MKACRRNPGAGASVFPDTARAGGAGRALRAVDLGNSGRSVGRAQVHTAIEGRKFERIDDANGGRRTLPTNLNFNLKNGVCKSLSAPVHRMTRVPIVHCSMADFWLPADHRHAHCEVFG